VSWLLREPQRDPQLATALRLAEAESRASDAEPLRQRIMAAARPRLGAFRPSPSRWWDWISRWMPVAVPLGLAASLAAALLVSADRDITTSAAYAADAGADSTLMIAAFSEGASGAQLAAHLVAPEGGDWLLEQAVIQ
jgi:hypothetical protein